MKKNLKSVETVTKENPDTEGSVTLAQKLYELNELILGLEKDGSLPTDTNIVIIWRESQLYMRLTEWAKSLDDPLKVTSSLEE